MEIPYVKQDKKKDKKKRMCAAASLSMIYRFLSIDSSQKDIWERIKIRDRNNNWFAKSHKLCADALELGLFSICIKAIDPIRSLKLCSDNSIPVIMNRRKELGSTEGHFTVFSQSNDDDIIFHDPLFGPNKRIKNNDLLDLWRPYGSNCEITGNILIAINDDPLIKEKCSVCNSDIPESVICPACTQKIQLLPNIILGCIEKDCSERAWEYIFCPWCDKGLFKLT